MFSSAAYDPENHPADLSWSSIQVLLLRFPAKRLFAFIKNDFDTRHSRVPVHWCLVPLTEPCRDCIISPLTRGAVQRRSRWSDLGSYRNAVSNNITQIVIQRLLLLHRVVLFGFSCVIRAFIFVTRSPKLYLYTMIK